MDRKNLERKKQRYLKLLNHIETKQKLDNQLVIIPSKKRCFVVDKKYEKISRFLVERYSKLLENESNDSTIRIKYICLMGMLGILKMATVTLFEEEISYENSFDHNFVLVEYEDNNYLEYFKESKEQLEQEKMHIEQVILEREQEIERIATYEMYLEEYSNYFHLDSEKVIQLAKTTSQNFKDFTQIVNCENADFTNPEASCMLFVYYLSRDELIKELSTFNLTIDDFITTNEIETTPHDNIYELYLSNGEKYTEFYGKICDFFAINNKSLALAASLIEISETGSYSSNTRNNVGGQRYLSGEYMEFSTLEAGIMSMCGNFKSKYNDYNEDSIEELACHYVSGKSTMPNPDKEEEKALYDEIIRWRDSVKSFYCKIVENYSFYFQNDYSEEDIFLVRKNQLGEGCIR